MTNEQEIDSRLIMAKVHRFRRDSEVGYMLTDHDVVQGIVEKTKVSYREAELFFNVEYENMKKLIKELQC